MRIKVLGQREEQLAKSELAATHEAVLLGLESKSSSSRRRCTRFSAACWRRRSTSAKSPERSALPRLVAAGAAGAVSTALGVAVCDEVVMLDLRSWLGRRGVAPGGVRGAEGGGRYFRRRKEGQTFEKEVRLTTRLVFTGKGCNFAIGRRGG